MMNVLNNDLTLKDLLDLLKRDIMLTLNCHALATVQSFDATKQTVVARINYARSYVEKKSDGTTGTVLVNYPILIDVPVIVLQGGGGALTMPIASGDACLILFNDRDIDAWLHSGQGGQPNATNRLHSFADGIALVGLNSLNAPLLNYDVIRAVLRKGGALVGVGFNDKVKIANQLFTLNELLQELITEIGELVTQTAAITVTAVSSGAGVSGPPANVVALLAIGSDITSTAAKIGALLE